MRELKQILAEQGFRFNKAYGQNFITDTNLLAAIVRDAGVGGDDAVLEIGPGGGTLTRELAATARRVLAYEIDTGLAPVLAESLAESPNAEVVFRDFLKVPAEEVNAALGTSFKAVANLPYYVTTPVLMRLLEGGYNVSSLTIMVQREVAERFTARPGTAAYGAVTVAVDARGTARVTRTVDRRLFYPVPKVDSAVVRIDIEDKYGIKDYAFFRRVYRSAFAMRRKTLANNLTAGLSLPRQAVEEALTVCGLAPSVRGEELDTRAFLKLSEALKKYF